MTCNPQCEPSPEMWGDEPTVFVIGGEAGEIIGGESGEKIGQEASE